MVIILKKNADHSEVEKLIHNIQDLGLKTHMIEGEQSSIIGLVGDTSKINADDISANDVVEAVRRVQEPYKLANRKFHEDDTIIDVNGTKIGGTNFQIIAGPCSVESREQIIEVGFPSSLRLCLSPILTFLPMLMSFRSGPEICRILSF